MSHLISVQLDLLGVLLGELMSLGAELAEEGELSASCGRSLSTALDGAVAEAAGGTGAGWAAAVTALAARTLAVAAALETAVDAYRVADAGLAGRIAAPADRWTAVPR